MLFRCCSNSSTHPMAAGLWATPLPRIQTQRLLPPPVTFAAPRGAHPRAVGSSDVAKAGGCRWSVGERSGGIVSEQIWRLRQRTGLNVRAWAGDEEFGGIKSSEEYQFWNSLTAKFSASSNLPFLLIQLPQIILNARNLLAGNKSALLAVPWLGMLTGLLGNLSLLSYFAKKREKEAIVVQTLGVVSIFAVVSQLAMGSAMPLPIFVMVSVVVASGLVLNCMYYFGFLNPRIWSFWEDFITIGGLSVLPQVMWSTFVPYVPGSILPGSAACIIAVVAVSMARTRKISEKGIKFVGALSGWTATLLFMWMPIAQMWTNIQFPENIKGLSASTMLLGMIGNALMVPRALFIRDFMWFTGSSWASFFYGYGNLVWLYCCNCISREYFLGATIGLFSWIGITFWRDTIAYGYDTPLRSIKELVFGP